MKVFLLSVFLLTISSCVTMPKPVNYQWNSMRDNQIPTIETYRSAAISKDEEVLAVKKTTTSSKAPRKAAIDAKLVVIQKRLKTAEEKRSSMLAWVKEKDEQVMSPSQDDVVQLQQKVQALTVEFNAISAELNSISVDYSLLNR